MDNRTPRHVLLFALTLVGALRCLGHAAPIARAQADDATERSLSPYFFIEDGDPATDQLPLEHTAVDFNVSGVIAEVTVKQQYKNAGTRPISARYIFPASVRAAVHGMRMRVGDEVIEAEIKEKQAAKATYEQAKSEGKTASLLEQERPNVFSMRVANVMPGDRIDVELRYTEHLIPTDGVYEFVYPTVVGPRYASEAEQQAHARGTGAGGNGWVKTPYTPESEAPTYTFGLTGRLSTGIPVQAVQVPTHQVSETWKRPDLVMLALDPADKRGGDRDFILRYRLAGKQIASGLMLYEGQDGDNHFLLTVQPPERVTPEQLPAREYVFVLDVSGSMGGFPLDTAKLVLRDLARGLRPKDSFNVLMFSGGSRVLWPASKPATQDNLDEAMAVIDGQRGGGGTEMLSALQRALAMPTRRGTARSFVVVTDGYISAERQAFTWVREHLGEASVFAFGIGSSVNRYLIDGLARAGMGEPFVITDHSESRAAAARFKRYIESPVLTDIRLRAEGFATYDVEPRHVPDLLANRPVVIQGKWRGRPDGRLLLQGRSGQGRFEHVVDVGDVAPDPEHRVLQRLWARTRIADISDFSFGQPTDAERQQVIDLGLKHNLLTQYTSFVAVSSRVRNPGGDSQDVDQPLPLPQGVSNSAVGPMYGAPEPELLFLLAGLLLSIVLRLGLRARGSLS